MILECPSCDTKYNFPDEKVTPGRKVKCTICGNVFELKPPAPPEPEEPEEDFDAFDESAFTGSEEASDPDDQPFEDDDFSDESLDSLFDDDGEDDEPADDDFSLDETPAPPPKAPAKDVDEEGVVLPEDVDKDDDKTTGKRVREEFSLDDDDSGGGGIDLDAMVGGKKSKKKRKKGPEGDKKSIVPILMGVVTLLLLGGGGWYFFMGGKDGDGPAVGEEAAQTEEVITTEQIKSFSLEDVNQYYVDNEKVGKIFVVQGKVINGFSTAKELITIQANLFDGNGASVVDKTLLAGNTVSLFQLQMLSEEELEAAINNKVGILTANTNVPPGGEVPFVITFYNPPDTVQEFGVKVVSAKNPPKE